MSTGSFATHFHTLPDGRRLAYSDNRGAHAADVLLCLPGLLETRATFDPVLHAAHAHTGLRVISLDLCGRGEADPLPGDQGYTMARYLEDVRHFIDHHLLVHPGVRLHLLGTSMGGILAMYLASDKALPVETLLLNDIGLTFYWVSIYGLYDTMKKGVRSNDPEEIAAELHVSQGVLLAVQSPAHFDLPYQRGWQGMKFGELLEHYRGGVRLVHGTESKVCLAQQVVELRQRFKQLRVCEVPGAGHPAPFNAEVCDFVLADLAPLDAAVVADTVPATPAVQPVQAEQPGQQLTLLPESASETVAEKAPEKKVPGKALAEKALAEKAPVPPQTPRDEAPATSRTVDGPTYKRLLWAWFRRKPHGDK